MGGEGRKFKDGKRKGGIRENYARLCEMYLDWIFAPPDM